MPLAWISEDQIYMLRVRPNIENMNDATKAGENTIRVHVANTIAPHYQTIPANNLGPTASGLIGPVKIRKETR